MPAFAIDTHESGSAVAPDGMTRPHARLTVSTHRRMLAVGVDGYARPPTSAMTYLFTVSSPRQELRMIARWAHDSGSRTENIIAVTDSTRM